MLRARSMKSLKSVKTDYSGTSDSSVRVDFEEFIHEAVSRFEVPISVAVVKDYMRDQYTKTAKASRKLKFKRESMMTPLSELMTSDEDRKLDESAALEDHTLVITAQYDFFNRLVELHMLNYDFYPIPRVLMQLIAMVVPGHRHLNKINIKHCRIDAYTIYELNKMLLTTNITDICLDHSLVPEFNYDILLSEATSLRNLSLARCNIDDDVCEKITARLHYLQPAERTLAALNLSSNNITDEGARHLAAALRTNRHLRYLNLSDNHIGDEGAALIFSVLSEFRLSREDIMKKTLRKMQYIKTRESLIQKCSRHFMNKSEEDAGSKRTMFKKTMKPKKDKKAETFGEDEYLLKAEMMADELLGTFHDPYSADHMTKPTNFICQGNLALCYLNLAYNNLSYLSVQMLLRVVLGQKPYKTDRYCGLLNVVLAGNCLPSECHELFVLNRELLKAISHYDAKHGGDRGYPLRKSGDKKSSKIV